MNELQTTIQNVTLQEIGTNPNTYPEEVVAAAFDTIKQFESVLKEYKQNISANMIARMNKDNATKIIFLDTKGNQRTLTLKKGSMKLNPDIKDYDKYIEKAGFIPESLGKMIFQPFPWKEMKETRKQGGDIQVLIDEIYKEGTPSLTVD